MNKTCSFRYIYVYASSALEKNVVYLQILVVVFFKCQVGQVGWSYFSDLILFGFGLLVLFFQRGVLKISKYDCEFVYLLV